LRIRLTTALLLILALAQMTGDLLGLTWLKGLAAATCASPAPKVFSAVEGLETYSTRFVLEWQDPRGERRELELDSPTYARLRGPYNRRNVYGAALAYGPVLASQARTRPMLEAVLRHALCPPRPLLAELGIDPLDVAGPVRIRYVPREGSELGALPAVLEASCP
jgi:hypothetical protein